MNPCEARHVDEQKRNLTLIHCNLHPKFSDRVNDGKEYRKKLNMYDEILEIIRKYGYLQDWNKDGK